MFSLNWVATQPFLFTLSHHFQSSSFILWTCTVDGTKKACILKDSTCVILFKAVTFCGKRILVFVVSPSTSPLEAMEFFNFDLGSQPLGIRSRFTDHDEEIFSLHLNISFVTTVLIANFMTPFMATVC